MTAITEQREYYVKCPNCFNGIEIRDQLTRERDALIAEAIQELEGLKHEQIDRGDSQEFPTAPPIHESNELLMQYAHNIALIAAITKLKELGGEERV